jgi:plasmid replication initiation protein
MRHRSTDEQQSELFQARASETAPRNARDLMFWPLFLVAESRHEAWLLSHRNAP